MIVRVDASIPLFDLFPFALCPASEIHYSQPGPRYINKCLATQPWLMQQVVLDRSTAPPSPESSDFTEAHICMSAKRLLLQTSKGVIRNALLDTSSDFAISSSMPGYHMPTGYGRVSYYRVVAYPYAWQQPMTHNLVCPSLTPYLKIRD